MVQDWPDWVHSGVVELGPIYELGYNFGRPEIWPIMTYRNSIKPKLKTALRNPRAAHDGSWRKLQFNGFVFKHFATSVVSTSTLKAS